ncbi:MAG: hypothetical protein GY765_22880, partial [bacterium]|nr:hypothetical protein [bacterium]
KVWPFPPRVAGPAGRALATLLLMLCVFVFVASPTLSAADKKQDTKKKQVKYTGEKGDFYFRDADLQNVLLFFARVYKFSIIIDPGIKGKVTINMKNVPWDQALDVILRQRGLAMVRVGKTIRTYRLGGKKKSK